jgi:hypothetical protein
MGRNNVNTVNSNNQNGIADFGQQHGFPDNVNVNPPQDNDDNDDYTSSFITFTPRLPPGSNNSYSLPSPIPEFGPVVKPIIETSGNNEETDSAYSINNIRYVDLTINDNKTLSVIDNLNNYEYFRGSIVTDKHLDDFYRKDSFDLNQEIKFLHSITCDNCNEPLTNITSFKDTKFEIINDITIKLENQFEKLSNRTNFLEFFNNNSKNNFNLKSEMISDLQSGLIKLDSFINENNYPNNILNLFEEKNTRSSFIGKILQESLKTNIVYEEKFNYKSNLTVPQNFEEYSLNINFNQENLIYYIQRSIGSIIQEDIYPFINSQDRLSSNSFIVQLIANIGFSMYGLYPTILLQNDDIYTDNFVYQDLKSTQPSIIVNFFKEYDNNFYNFNIFSNINVNSKSFDPSIYIKNDLFFYNEKEFTFNEENLPKINTAFVEIDSDRVTQELHLTQGRNYTNFLKFMFGGGNIDERLEKDPVLTRFRLNDSFTQQFVNQETIDQMLFKLFDLRSSVISQGEKFIHFSPTKSFNVDHAGWHHNFDLSELNTLNNQDNFISIFKILDFLNTHKTFIDNNNFYHYFHRHKFNINNVESSRNMKEKMWIELASTYFPTNISDNITILSPQDDTVNILGLSNVSMNPRHSVFRNFYSEEHFHIKIDIYENPMHTSRIDVALKYIILPNNYIEVYNTYKSIINMSNDAKINFFSTAIHKVNIINSLEGTISSYVPNNESFSSILINEFHDYISKSLKHILLSSFLDDTMVFLNGSPGNYGPIFMDNIYYQLTRFLSNSLSIDESIVNEFHSTFSKNFNGSISLSNLKEYLLGTTIQFSQDAQTGERALFANDILNTNDNISGTLFNNIHRKLENESSNDIIDNFVSNIDNSSQIDNHGYLYYSKGFDRPLTNCYNEDTLKLSDLNKMYNINSYELSYLIDKFIKKIKLYTLENNNIDYSVFKDITDKISKMRIDSLEIPIISENVKKELSAVSEGDELFDLLVKKDIDNNKFYTSFDFTSNNDYKGFDINDTISLLLEKKELLNNNNEEFLQNFLKLVSRYYYNNTINSSSQFLSSCIQRITNDLNSYENSNENKILQFLYFSNFELGNKVSDFDSKNEITKRFIKKSISKRINSSDNLRNSDLGFTFDINSVDMDKLSNYHKERILSESEEIENDGENSEIKLGSNYIEDRNVAEVSDYFESLFDTNIEYKKIKNAIFNNNISINSNYEFYYIPTSSIKSNNDKRVNLHVSFSKSPNDHQDFLSTVEECGFLFDCYSLVFPFTSFIKRNIPFKIPSNFLDRVKNQSFNNESLVKNYCTFNTNINSKVASSYINFCIKNERKELTTISRKKIVDNFDEISNIEISSFRKILSDINVMLSATTNINDLNFEDVEDIDKFIDDNKFIIGLSASIISIYSEIYNNMFKENQLNKFWNSLESITSQESSAISNYINTDRYYKIEIDNKKSMDISEFNSFNFSDTNLGFSYNDIENSWNISNFNFNNNYNQNKFIGYKDILGKNLIKLTFSDFNQAISFDMLYGYLNKKNNFLKDKDLETKILNSDLQKFYNITNLDNRTTSKFSNLFYLNTLSKELSRKFYYNKDFYSNFISNQEESEDIKNHYLNNIDKFFNLYKEKEKFLNNDTINLENFNLKNNNILTFGITNKFIKSLRPTSIVKIKITNGESGDTTFYFSPLLTSVYPFFNDYINLDTHVGLYDIYSNINKRYLIADKDDIFKVTEETQTTVKGETLTTYRTSGYVKNFFGNNINNRKIQILRESLRNIIVSNKLNNLLNLIFNFEIDVEDFYKNIQLNNNTTSIDLLNIVNTISAFNFKKFSNISKSKFNNRSIIDNENSIVILPGFEEMIDNRTSIFETLNNINKIYSIEEINNSFREKVFYDFYHIHLRSGIDKYENIKITVDIEEL